MPLNLSGKFWRVDDLERELGKPVAIIYPLLNNLQGVIKVGYAFLVPDYLIPNLKAQIEKKDSYTISSLARMLNCSNSLINALILKGLPVITCADSHRIPKKYLKGLKSALQEVQIKYGGVSAIHAEEILSLAYKYN